MIIKKTANIDDIKAVLCHTDIYDTISGDNCPLIDEFEPPVTEDYLYIGGYVNNKIVALMVYHKYLDGNECHVQVLPEYRKKHAKEFGEKSLKFKGDLPLYAEIPALYENVLSFALMNNFEVINTLKGSYTKNGKPYDTKVLRYKNGLR